MILVWQSKRNYSPVIKTGKKTTITKAITVKSFFSSIIAHQQNYISRGI